MRFSALENLRLISEYVSYSDAPALLGIYRGTLTRYVKGSLSVSRENAKKIAKVAGKFRRRAAQLKRYSEAEAIRSLRRSTRSFMRQHGIKAELPVVLPPLFETIQQTANASPVYVYDVRGMNEAEMLSLLRFFKRTLPHGAWSFTWEVLPGGTSPGGGKYIHEQRVPHIGHSRYFYFCQRNNPGAGDCLVLLDHEILCTYNEYHDPSAKRYVTAVAISYPKLTEFTEEEKAEDIARGADPLTGLRYIFED